LFTYYWTVDNAGDDDDTKTQKSFPDKSLFEIDLPKQQAFFSLLLSSLLLCQQCSMNFSADKPPLTHGFFLFRPQNISFFL